MGPNEKTILAFDFGLRKIGVAVGNTETKTSLALDIIKVKNEKILWGNIEQLIEEWKPGFIVVGDPINMDGTKSRMCEKARKFARRLTGRFSVQVNMFDERLTSFEAKAMLSKNKEAKSIDSFAAKIILEDWMRTIDPSGFTPN